MTQPLSPLQHPGLGITDGRALCRLSVRSHLHSGMRAAAAWCRGEPSPEPGCGLWAFLYCASVSSFGPLDMRALLACIPSSCEKGFRPGQQYHKLPCTRKGKRKNLTLGLIWFSALL